MVMRLCKNLCSPLYSFVTYQKRTLKQKYARSRVVCLLTKKKKKKKEEKSEDRRDRDSSCVILTHANTLLRKYSFFLFVCEIPFS